MESLQPKDGDALRAIVVYLDKLREHMSRPGWTKDIAGEIAIYEHKADVFEKMARHPASLLWSETERKQCEEIARGARAHLAALAAKLTEGKASA